MTVDMNRVKEILEEYVQSPGFEGDVERRIREYDQTLAASSRIFGVIAVNPKP